MKAALAPVAQWLEQRAYTSSVPDKHMVVGSNPTGGTFKQLKLPFVSVLVWVLGLF